MTAPVAGPYTGRGRIRLAPQARPAQRGGARELPDLSPDGTGNHTEWYRCPAPRVFGPLSPHASPRPLVWHLLVDESNRPGSELKMTHHKPLTCPTRFLGGGGVSLAPATFQTTRRSGA